MCCSYDIVPNTSQQFQTYTKARVVLTTADTTGSPNGFLLVVVVIFQIYLKINLNSSVIQLFSIFNLFQAIGTKCSSVFIYTEQQLLPGTVVQPPHYPKGKSKSLLTVCLPVTSPEVRCCSLRCMDCMDVVFWGVKSQSPTYLSKPAPRSFVCSEYHSLFFLVWGVVKKTFKRNEPFKGC